MKKSEWSFNTQAIHFNDDRVIDENVISQSIVPAVAYSFDTVEDAISTVNGKNDGIYYGRYGNPTTRNLESKMSKLEGTEDALGVSSGMAAISIALINFLQTGDHVIVTKDIYGGTYKFLNTIGKRYQIQFSFVDCTNINEIKKNIKKNTKALYIETPSNPSLILTNIRDVSEVAKKNKIPLIVDNTFMTPYLQKPIDFGADVVVHSATKYLNGHGDVIAGVICGSKKVIENMRKNVMGDLGQNLNAWESFLILRGLKTLGIRMKQHCRSAREIADFLISHPMISKVNYIGLPSHPQYELALEQMDMMGGIISFELKGGNENIKKFMNSLSIAKISFSLGDPETLVQHPASMTHSSIPDESLKEFGISENLIRLSVGLEETEDIIKDLEIALSKSSKF